MARDLTKLSTTPSSNDSAGGWQTGMAPSSVKSAGWADESILAQLFNALPSGGGTANAQTLTNPVPFTSLTTGLTVIFMPSNTNTGATTFAPDGLTAKNVFANGAACKGGEINSSVPCWLKYDGTQWHILNPQRATGSFTITLTGMTGTVTGTVNYAISQDGKGVDIWVPASITGTSNATTMTGTGVPSVLSPTTSKRVFIPLEDGGALANPSVLVTGTSTTWTFGMNLANTGFNSAAVTKGMIVGAARFTLD